MLKQIIYGLITLGLCLESAIAVEETQKYENYLNSVKTLSGHFTQVNSKGQKATGLIQISRPGKMRLTYNPPSPLLIVADGKWLITKDREADEVNYSSLDKTPAAFILRPHIRFSGDVEVTNIVPKGETTEISLIRKEDPDAGYITLVFNDNPIALKEWSLIDPQGIETRVLLSQLQENVNLPSNLFKIDSPNLLQQIF
ncbi:MAG: outer membrane lipoprotein carrier protein LolA [Alphaproteobacteria bacterium]|nr:outer membrane lipoprotein carrier protein LolA [Alphaproteobacteria bacterium]